MRPSQYDIQRPAKYKKPKSANAATTATTMRTNHGIDDAAAQPMMPVFATSATFPTVWVWLFGGVARVGAEEMG